MYEIVQTHHLNQSVTYVDELEHTVSEGVIYKIVAILAASCVHI
jgi:hypothetical protein